jgi:hypothetical protein
VIDQPATSTGAGCGLLGCLGGVILGLFGGAFLAVAIALFLAISAPVPGMAPTAPGNPDIKITLTEDFLNRYAAAQPTEGTVEIDLKPANQVQINANTVADVLGLPVPVQITGLFQFEVTPQAVQISLLDTQVFGLDIELSGLFDEDIAQINQEIDTLMQDVSQTLGAPMTLSGFSTTDTTIDIEMREAQ